MFDEGDGHVAEGWRELGVQSRPLRCVCRWCVASVMCVHGALGGTSAVMSADVGMFDWVAGGLGVDGDGGGLVDKLPFGD